MGLLFYWKNGIFGQPNTMFPGEHKWLLSTLIGKVYFLTFREELSWWFVYI